MRQQGASTVLGVSRALLLQLAVATLARLLLNTAKRFAYPFAPVLSRELGVPITAVTRLIAVNQGAGLLAPLFGPLADRWGYRMILLAGMALLAVGSLVAGVAPSYPTVLFALLLAGLAKSVFDPALQAYVGQQVPLERRGLAMGAIEVSWAGSSLVGIPLVGVLIARLGWRSPFVAMGVAAILSLVVLGALLPRHPRSASRQRRRRGTVETWKHLAGSRCALGALGFSLLISAANDSVFVVYGAWLEDSFGLGVVALGAATTVIGVAELSGESLTAALADRLGLKRATVGGLIVSAMSYALLPWVGRSLPLALLSLFVVFVAFEFTIVTSFSLFTEILPSARATMMSANVACSGIGRLLGALLGGSLWLAGGLPTTAITSATLSALALLSLGWGLRDWKAIDRDRRA